MLLILTKVNDGYKTSCFKSIMQIGQFVRDNIYLQSDTLRGSGHVWLCNIVSVREVSVRIWQFRRQGAYCEHPGAGSMQLLVNHMPPG